MLLAGTLQACSGIKLAYNNGPELAAWWLNLYADLDKPQMQQVRDDLRQLQRQHRQQLLPSYAQWLHQAQTLVVHDLAPEDVCAMAATVRGFVDELLPRIEPAATTLALSLTPVQISHLEQKYAKNNRAYFSDWLALDGAEMHEKRYDKALERTEMVYGHATTAQKTLLRQQIEQSHFDPQRVQAERLRRQADILGTLRQLQRDTPGVEQARTTIHGLLERTAHPPQAAYQEYAASLEKEDCQSIAIVHNSTSMKQREAAAHWLGDYEQALQELVQQR